MSSSATRFVQFLNRFAQRFSSAPRRIERKQRFGSHGYQALEDRRLLAVFVVNTITDDLSAQPDGLLSLREAITAANTNAAFGDASAGESTPDFILFSPSIAGQTISLSGSALEITDGLVFRGDGRDITIDAGGQSRIFSINTDQRVAFTELTISGGEALEGGAVLTQGEGRVQFFRSTISNNVSTARLSSGGAILNVNSNLLLSNSEVTDNVSNGVGGGIYSTFGTVQLHQSTVSSNVATTGGGIAIAFGNLFSTDSVISSNEFSSRPISVEDGDASGLLGDVLSSEQREFGGGGGIALLGTATAVINNTTISENSANSGGGIYISEDSRSFLARGTEVSLNEAVDPVGDFRFSSGGGISNAGILRATDVTFSSNSATASFQGGFGGAIVSNGGVMSFHRSLFSDNFARGGAGAIDAVGTQLNISESTFSGNSDQGNPFPEFVAGGGAIAFGGGDAVVVNSIFEGNVGSSFGGAISLRGSATNFQLIGSQFIRNVSQSFVVGAGPNFGGGAIINASGNLEIYSSEFVGNTAEMDSGAGGAVLSAGGTLTVAGSSFFENVAQGSGGALAITGGSAVVFESTFGDENGRGNLARRVTDFPSTLNRGGAIFVDGTADNPASLRIHGSTLAGNRARHDGGGLFAGDNTQVEIFSSPSQQTRFIGNQALAQDGGGVFFQSSDVRIVDAVFESNQARSGAGIYADGARLTLVRSQVTSNEARRFGDDFFDDTESFDNFGSTIDDVFEA